MPSKVSHYCLHIYIVYSNILDLGWSTKETSFLQDNNSYNFVRERVQFQNISFPYIAYAIYWHVLRVFYECKCQYLLQGSVLLIYSLFRTVYILIHPTLFMKGDYYIYKQNISCDVTIHVGLLLRIAQGLKLARIHSSYLINYFVSHFYFGIVARYFW